MALKEESVFVSSGKKKANVRREISAVSGMRVTIMHKNQTTMLPTPSEPSMTRGRSVSRENDRGADLIVFEYAFFRNDINLQWKKSFAGHFFLKFQMSYFLKKEARTVSRPFCPNLRFCFVRVHMLGLRAWGDDLIPVLFEFIISHRVSLLSHVSVVPCVFVLDSDKNVSFFFAMASKKVLTQGDFCAAP